MIEGWPLPFTENPEDNMFWRAAGDLSLVVQACSGCERLRFPPRPMCPWCQTKEHEWQRMSGKGRIWSFVVAHPPLLPVFAEIAPFAVIVVELDEDPTIRMVGNLVTSADGEINEIAAEDIKIGAEVEVVFRSLADDVNVPAWTLSSSSRNSSGAS